MVLCSLCTGDVFFLFFIFLDSQTYKAGVYRVTVWLKLSTVLSSPLLCDFVIKLLLCSQNAQECLLATALSFVEKKKKKVGEESSHTSRYKRAEAQSGHCRCEKWFLLTIYGAWCVINILIWGCWNGESCADEFRSPAGLKEQRKQLLKGLKNNLDFFHEYSKKK